MKKIRNLDFTIVILICTIVFIGCIYIYFTNVQNKRIEYDLYDKNLYSLKILNDKFDNFVLNSIAFENYDEIVKDVKKFEDILNGLENFSAYKEFDKDLNPSMGLIKENFLKKKDIVERYKSRLRPKKHYIPLPIGIH